MLFYSTCMYWKAPPCCIHANIPSTLLIAASALYPNSITQAICTDFFLPDIVRCCNPAKTRKQTARSHGKPCWSSTVCSPPSSRKQKSCTSSRGILPRMLRRQKPPKPRRPTTSPPSLQKSKLPLMRNPPSDGRSATCAWSTVTTAASLRASSAPASTSTLTLANQLK